MWRARQLLVNAFSVYSCNRLPDQSRFAEVQHRLLGIEAPLELAS
jgi:hypothetical protein